MTFQTHYRELNSPVKRAEQRIYIDLLVEHLDTKQSGMYRDEVAELLELDGFPIETFLSILIQDSRFKVSTGRCVYLAKWGEPRRETVGRAVQMVLDEAREPLPLDVIVNLVAQRTGRRCEKSQISSALQTVGAVYNDDARAWIKADESHENVSDDDEQPMFDRDNQAGVRPLAFPMASEQPG